jgi:hypothetical protein
MTTVAQQEITPAELERRIAKAVKKDMIAKGFREKNAQRKAGKADGTSRRDQAKARRLRKDCGGKFGHMEAHQWNDRIAGTNGLEKVAKSKGEIVDMAGARMEALSQEAKERRAQARRPK